MCVSLCVGQKVKNWLNKQVLKLPSSVWTYQDDICMCFLNVCLDLMHLQLCMEHEQGLNNVWMLASSQDKRIKIVLTLSVQK